MRPNNVSWLRGIFRYQPVSVKSRHHVRCFDFTAVRKMSDQSRSQPKSSEVLFGIHPVKEALRQGRRQLTRLFLKHDFESNPKLEQIADAAAELGVPVDFRSVGELDRMTDIDKFNNFRPHQGVCLRCSPLTVKSIWTFSEFLSVVSLTSQWLFPILVDVKDPMNLGAILRSSSFFGIQHLLILGQGGMRRVSPVVSKASSGAAEALRLATLEDGVGFLSEAKELGVTILGTSVPETDENDEHGVGNGAMKNPSTSSHPTGVHLYDGVSGLLTPSNSLPRQYPTFLLFGSEGQGLNPDLLRLCDFRVTINPNRAADDRDVGNNVDSLNVSVASGILLNHFLCS